MPKSASHHALWSHLRFSFASYTNPKWNMLVVTERTDWSSPKEIIKLQKATSFHYSAIRRTPSTSLRQGIERTIWKDITMGYLFAVKITVWMPSNAGNRDIFQNSITTSFRSLSDWKSHLGILSCQNFSTPNLNIFIEENPAKVDSYFFGTFEYWQQSSVR